MGSSNWWSCLLTAASETRRKQSHTPKRGKPLVFLNLAHLLLFLCNLSLLAPFLNSSSTRARQGHPSQFNFPSTLPATVLIGNQEYYCAECIPSKRGGGGRKEGRRGAANCGPKQVATQETLSQQRSPRLPQYRCDHHPLSTLPVRRTH